MTINQEFRNAVQNDDIILVRIMLKDSLIIDPTFKNFDEMIYLADNKLNCLFDKHDGEVLEYDKNNWDKQYMDKQMVRLISNFSKERIDLLKAICRFFYREKAETIERQRTPTYKPSNISVKKKLGIGCVAGGIVVSVAGIIVSKPIILATGVVASVVGGALIIVDKLGE